ncbi:hypothetical protein K491DRAFT_693640 [Lophiostoma macrostomum CBS 122681]|uniref:Glycine-rich cell wall structural protein 1 n=1 Tax=Lophiostoma macrostomum CBS 122681 TaxID=1314788 RepID=A0A6A6T3X0_9PLEO|nr:hypothetical protein K491DRAFT_693640 [Lophiostoma macrostomum CBS 122681]
METLSNVASAASKAIFGEQNNPQATTQGNETLGQEPISGSQGKGTVNEPFDQGNSENPTSTTPATSTNDNNSSGLTGSTSSGLTDRTSSGLTGNTSTGLTGDTSSGLTDTSSNDKSSSGLTGTSTTDTTSSSNPTGMSSSDLPNNPTSVAAGGEPNPLSSTDKTGVTAGREGEATKGSDIIPTERQENPGAAPASGSGPEFKQQGADKPGDAPTGVEEGAVKEKKNEAEDLLAKKDPNDHSGEPLKVHGETQAERRESKVGNPGGQEHGKDEPKGTGEQWVKTSGLAVDGGDFDATKPGAGREADRLLEEKGIHKSEPGQPTPEPLAGASKTSDKPSVTQKLKDKLHIGHKDK